MPYYEYKCQKCFHTFSVKQTFQEHDQRRVVKCPKCDSRRVEQQLSLVSVCTSKKS